ncbi:hypothetical protein [Janthinobacterium sp. DSP2-3-3]|uniref:hypothetical protein n=1 Tax=Janthinobacterium sp. DSP2-3-3 TaxID=2804596 RepID=UPI003CEC2D44
MRQTNRNYLFHDGDLSSTLDDARAAATEAVSLLPRDQFLSTSIDTLVEHLTAQHHIEPLQLLEEHTTMDQQEARVEVTGRFDYATRDSGRTFAAGHELTFYIPYTGDVRLWHLKANMFFSVVSVGSIDPRSSSLIIQLANTSNTDAARYKQAFDSEITRIRQIIQAQGGMLSAYHNELPTLVRGAIDRRRAELEKLNVLASVFNIPMVKKSGMPEFRPIEVARRIARPLPRPAATGFKPEPAINTEMFEDVLSIIRHAGASFEGAPQTYKSLGEEGLRDNVLSHLNALFEGRATGETFRKYGKTDIRIEEESRAAFVGECKLWGGEKILLEALNQLLDYVTWRDCKSALVIFNKDVAGFSEIQGTVARALPTHPNFLRAKETSRIGEWRYVFKSAEDPVREVTVHVFMFNLYLKPERSAKKR